MKFKALYVSALGLCLSAASFAQKVSYKSGIIQVDDKDVAKVNKIKDKETFGLTSSYEISSLNDEKLIIATVATDLPESRSDNSVYYYRLAFLPTGQTGIFTVSKLGTEKSMVKLIGESNIITDNKLDQQKVTEFIALKGKTPPPAAIEYHLVRRNGMIPPRLKDDKTIQQGLAIIGAFKDISVPNTGLDTYEFSLPGGLVVAKAIFAGGNKAQVIEMVTNKDQMDRRVNIPSDTRNDVLYAYSIDRNQIILQRIVLWLVKNEFL